MMSRRISATINILILLCTLAAAAVFPPGQNAAAQEEPPAREETMDTDPQYLEAIQRTDALTSNEQARRLAAAYGLNIVNVTWEDTGRYKGSSVGPNISDVTIQVQYRDPASGQYRLSLMPVIRYPNFSDLTADISLDDFYLLVGNEKDQPLDKVSLREYLGDLRRYLNHPNSWSGEQNSLLAERDSHVLVSAQAAFLPVPKQGLAEFNPVIFNYQSMKGDPAVLTIVATREGASATVIDNTRDAFLAGPTWGQRLFFNQDGERSSFTGQRLSDFSAGVDPALSARPDSATSAGLNMVLVIQVPLKQKTQRQTVWEADLAYAMPVAPMAARSDVEIAVIGHGKVEGPYTEIDYLPIERDPDYPIRVTVQFYKATSNGVVSEADVQEIAEQIKRVYDQGDYVGSLVVSGETNRPTEYYGPKEEPPGWWDAFWQRNFQNTGLSRQEVFDLWRKLKLNAGRWFENR